MLYALFVDVEMSQLSMRYFNVILLELFGLGPILVDCLITSLGWFC